MPTDRRRRHAMSTVPGSVVCLRFWRLLGAQPRGTIHNQARPSAPNRAFSSNSGLAISKMNRQFLMLRNLLKEKGSFDYEFRHDAITSLLLEALDACFRRQLREIREIAN